MPHVTSGKILLYLPWEFDMLGGVDVVVDRLWRGREARFPGRGTIGVQDWANHGERVDDDGRRFFHLNLPAPPAIECGLPLRYWISLAWHLPKALRDLRQHDISIVNVHFPTLNVYPLALLKRFRLWRGRIVLSFHGSEVDKILPNCSLWKTIAGQTEAITACSVALAGHVKGLGLFRQEVQVVHNGIDCRNFVNEADLSEQLVSGQYLLNVGNYVPNKAQDILLRAFAQMSAMHPELKLVCAGATLNGVWLNNLKKLANRINLDKRVVFLENLSQSQVASLMCHAVCLVHTAYKEAFGLVLIEAGTCFTPVIATRVGGVPEIIPSDEFGLLFEAGDVDSLANAISSVINSPEEARKRSVRLQNRINDLFSSKVMVDQYSKVLLGID